MRGQQIPVGLDEGPADREILGAVLFTFSALDTLGGKGALPAESNRLNEFRPRA